jgi:hypothetical protein
MGARAARPVIELAAFVGSLPSVIAGRGEAHQAQGGLQGKGVFAAIDRTQDFGLGCPVRQALLIETEPRELEEHNQKPNHGGLPFGAALKPFVFVQDQRDLLLPIEGDHAAASA